MSNFQTFRELAAYSDGDIDYRTKMSLRPSWAVINDKTVGGPREKAESILNHINLMTRQLLEWREPITRVQRLNSMLYKGRHYLSQDPYSHIPYTRGRNYDKEQAKTVLNYIGQAVDLHVSALCSYEPQLTVMPANDEESDRTAARANKQVLDYYFYENQLKSKFRHFHRRKKIHGETFLLTLWNPDIGDYSPRYKELRRIRQEMGEDPDAPIPLLDPENGQPILSDEDSSPLFITEQVRTGDIQYRFEFSERILYPCPESCLWDDVEEIIWLEWLPVDEVKARWPKSIETLAPDGMYSAYMNHRRTLQNKVCVRHYYHRPTRFLDKGYYCATTESTFLEGSSYPFNYNYLPLIRGTDIDLDFEITGMSFIQWLASLNYAINDSTSMIMQNQSLFAYPKWQVPRGARIRHTDLGDERGIYEYNGAKGAELMIPNSTPQDTWRYRDAMKDEFSTLSMVFAPSKGRGVDGITANVALRMLEEEERKAYKPAIDKHAADCERLGTLTLATLATYRDPTDGMLIKILGKNDSARYIKNFDVSNLAKKWEVKLIKSSGLPESPAARVQTVLDIDERKQGLFDDNEILDAMDIAMPEKLIKSATISKQAAESEVEDIMSGVVVLPPQPYHDILPKYKVYIKAVQSRDFDDADQVIKQRMLNHIISAEYLIGLKMKNPAFAQIVLTQFPNFPTYMPVLQPPAAPMMLPQPQPPPMPGAAAGAPALAGLPPEARVGNPEEMMPPPDGMETGEVPNNLPPAAGASPDAGALP